MRAAKERRLKLDEVELDDDAPRYWVGGRFAITTTVLPVGRSGYPSSVHLLFRGGDDRQFTGFDLTWADASELHEQLGRVLADRQKLERAVADAKAR